MTPWRRWLGSIIAVSFCVVFVGAALAFIPLLGIENDESLFGSALYAPRVLYSLPIGNTEIPLMLMSYLGALKGLLYGPVFRQWPPGPYSIRLPMALVGAITVWLFFLLLRRTAGDRAAVIGAVLLTTDSLYFLTTVFDWGPVALQHLLLVGGMLLCVKFRETRRWPHLASAFFAFGLGVWDKALFGWVLAGLAAAALTVYWGEFRRLWTPGRATLAAAAFALGALPLLLYNLASGLQTARVDSGFAPGEIPPKFGFLVESIQDGVFDWMIASSDKGRMSPLGVAFLVALILWPVVRQRRAMSFAIVYMAVVWLQMAVTRNAGASVHHTVLLWPFPQWFLALALAQAWPPLGRRLAAAGAVAIVAWNAVVLYDYGARMSRNGGALLWTDAIYPLADFAQAEPFEYYAVDWGILENLTLLGQGRVAVYPAWPSPDPAQLSSDRVLFLTHTPGNEVFPGANARLDDLAAQLGLKREVVRTIADTRGKPIFQVLRFRNEP